MRSRKSNRSISDFEGELVAAVVKETGFQPWLAMILVRPIIDYLVKNYGGERVYIPTPRRQYPVADIIEAVEATRNPKAVCERFGISDSTLYRLIRSARAANEAPR